MAKIDELVVNFAVYEDANEYLGMAEATLPDLEYLAEEMDCRECRGNHNRSFVGNDNHAEFPHGLQSGCPSVRTEDAQAGFEGCPAADEQPHKRNDNYRGKAHYEGKTEEDGTGKGRSGFHGRRKRRICNAVLRNVYGRRESDRG